MQCRASRAAFAPWLPWGPARRRALGALPSSVPWPVGSRHSSEAAIAGYNTKREAKKNLADSAYPFGGWESFQKYVYKKLGRPVDTLENDDITDGCKRSKD